MSACNWGKKIRHRPRLTPLERGLHSRSHVDTTVSERVRVDRELQRRDVMLRDRGVRCDRVTEEPLRLHVRKEIGQDNTSVLTVRIGEVVVDDGLISRPGLPGGDLN